MKKILKMYKDAHKKHDEEQYINLKNELIKNLKEEKSDNINKERLKYYQMLCSNYRFLDFNLALGAVMISIASLAFSLANIAGGNAIYTIISGVVGIIIIAIAAIWMKKRELKINQVLFVLNEIEQDFLKK